MSVAVQYLAGRYRLIERLGAGGMSVVWRAYDEVLGRPVAIKMLGPRLAADPDSRDRIRAEAQIAARLCHPYITNVYDYGESAAGDGRPLPFVVMELVDGVPLDARLRSGPLSWRHAVELCGQVAAALAAVHARGLVHRDIKPANVMLTATGAKVVDFGISAIVGDRPPPGSRIFGTPAYLAPERLDGGPADAASDVYALGLVLYRALTGHLPWDAETTTQMLTAHCYVDPDPLPRISGLPPAVVDLCHRCLTKEPARRPRAQDVARTLTDQVLRVGPARQRAWPRVLVWRWPRPVRVAALASGLGLAALLLVTGAGPDPAASPAPAQARSPADPLAEERNAGRAAAPELGCQVEYATRSDLAGQFVVDVTVVNGGAQPLTGWNLSFEYTGGQRVLALEGARFAQEGERVTVYGPAPLDPGAAARVGLTGAYGATNPMPTAFEVDGRRCASQVVGAAGSGVPLAGEPAPGAAPRGAPRADDDEPKKSKKRKRGKGG